MNSSLPHGVIFDMDGVLVDSEPFICQAACMMYKELNLTVEPDDFLPFVGTGEDRYLGGVAEKYNFSINVESAKKRTYDIYLEIIKGALTPLPGVKEFIKTCKQANKKIALASSADLRKVEGNLHEIGLSPDSFDACVTGEDVEHKKPSPDIFLLAAKRLNLSPQNCLVIEDAITGVQAAKAAGARCLALTTSFTPTQLIAADYHAKNLAHADHKTLNW